MPRVLERLNQPSYHEYDPAQLPDINFGFAESHPNGGDRVLENVREGSFGLLSAHNQTEQIDRETIDLIAPLIERNIDDAQFDKENPEQYMRDIFRMSQEEIRDAAASKGNDYQTRIDMTLVKVFVDPADNQLKAVYGHTGRHSITYSPDGKPPQGFNKPFEESLMEQGMGMPPINEDVAEFAVIPFNDGDRLMIQSRNAAGYERSEGYSPRELSEANKIRDPKAAAKKLIWKNDSYENRTALVIDAPYDYGDDNERTGWQRFRGRLSKNRGEDTDDGNNRRAGMLGGAAVLGAMASRRGRDGSSRWSLGRNRNRSRDDDEVYVADDGTTRVVDNHGSVLVDQETRRRGGAKRALLLGALAVGSVLALRYGVDLGDDISNWIGDRPDTGVDVWPFGDGDLDDGNGNGWDLNPTNENLDRNDDPVNESFRDTGGFDILPPFFDGDWFSMNEGLNVDLPNADGEPNVDIDKDGDVDAPEATADTPERLLDAPEATAPEVEAPDPPQPPQPPQPPAPQVWTPDSFTVENGHGLIQEIHEIGHEIVGNDFNNQDAARVYEAVRSEYGVAAVELPNHSGPDLYQYGNELRISAPGEAHWASQQIENFVHEKIRETAAV